MGDEYYKDIFMTCLIKLLTRINDVIRPQCYEKCVEKIENFGLKNKTQKLFKR